MRVALVHDWLTGMRGGERVLEALLELHPRAELFTLLHVPGSVSPRIEDRPIHTSFLQRLPAAALGYRYLLPLFPRAVASLDVRGFDLVISSSHCVAKGVRVPPGVPHLCYCHTPMRYVWDQFEAYFGRGRAPLAVRTAMRALAPRLRRWDVETAAGVDRFVANSRHVEERIRRCYGREAAVVHPPVEVERFTPARERGDFYLMLGAAAPYKRADLAIEACARLGRPLVIAGRAAGRGMSDRRPKEAGGSAANGGAPFEPTFMHAPSDRQVADLLARARALLLPGVEDFGIGVVEALASGTPVVAYGRGGVLDTVRPLGGSDDHPPTGVFFDEPTADALARAIVRCEEHRFDSAALAASARAFGRERFLEAMRREEALLLRAFGRPRHASRARPITRTLNPRRIVSD